MKLYYTDEEVKTIEIVYHFLLENGKLMISKDELFDYWEDFSFEYYNTSWCSASDTNVLFNFIGFLRKIK